MIKCNNYQKENKRKKVKKDFKKQKQNKFPTTIRKPIQIEKIEKLKKKKKMFYSDGK